MLLPLIILLNGCSNVNDIGDIIDLSDVIGVSDIIDMAGVFDTDNLINTKLDKNIFFKANCDAEVKELGSDKKTKIFASQIGVLENGVLYFEEKGHRKDSYIYKSAVHGSLINIECKTKNDYNKYQKALSLSKKRKGLNDFE